MSKKKSPLPIPEPIGVRTWIPKVGVLMVIVLAALVTFYAQSKPESTPSPPAAVTTTTQPKAIDPGPTPEQEKFIRERLLADCDRIAAQYPIEPIRIRFASLVQRMARKEILLHCSAGYLNETQIDAVALADQHEGKPLIQFFVPAVVDHYNKITDVETRDDTIVGILLHEEYHIKHHVFTDRTGQDPKLFLPIEEGQAWWCVTELYLPMVQNGRLKQLPANDSVHSALRAYHDAHGNPASRPWMQFSLSAASTGPH